MVCAIGWGKPVFRLLCLHSGRSNYYISVANYQPAGSGVALNPGPLSLSNSLKRKKKKKTKTGGNGGEREGLVQYDAEVC